MGCILKIENGFVLLVGVDILGELREKYVVYGRVYDSLGYVFDVCWNIFF